MYGAIIALFAIGFFNGYVFGYLDVFSSIYRLIRHIIASIIGFLIKELIRDIIISEIRNNSLQYASLPGIYGGDLSEDPEWLNIKDEQAKALNTSKSPTNNPPFSNKVDLSSWKGNPIEELENYQNEAFSTP